MDPRQRKMCGLLVSGTLAALVFSGCGSAVPRHTAGIWVGDQGSASEVVFDSPTVLAAMDKAREDGRLVASGDDSWRDRGLSIRGPESAYEQSAWPSARRPSLDRTRRINLTPRSDTFLFFQQETTTRSRERGVFFTP